MLNSNNFEVTNNLIKELIMKVENIVTQTKFQDTSSDMYFHNNSSLIKALQYASFFLSKLNVISQNKLQINDEVKKKIIHEANILMDSFHQDNS